MKIEHIAMYVSDLERSRVFYQRYFAAKASDLYHNPKTGLKTYFLSFSNGCRLEIMTRPDLERVSDHPLGESFAHMAFSVGQPQDVDNFVCRLAADGYIIESKSRVTGDGYYEAVILDPDKQMIEVVADKKVK